jgi:predicted CoA-binding protein
MAMPHTPDEARVRAILAGSHTIAVLGAHWEPQRAAYYVPEYLRSQGYRILPVNPEGSGRELFGELVVSRLSELEAAVDIVDVFRRSSALPDHVEDILAMDPRPRVVWFQLGIRNDEVADVLERAGIEVVQDRCTLADHRRFRLPPLRAHG